MKLAFVSPYYYPAMIGGIEWYLYHVTRRLAGKGHEVHMYTTDSDGRGGRLPREETAEDVVVHRIPTLLDTSYRLKIWPKLISRLSRDSFDVVHAFDYAQFHDLAVALSRRSSSWPAAVSVYDIHSEIPRGILKSIPLKLFDHLGAGLLLKEFDGVLVRTPYHYSFTDGLGIPRERVFIAPPGIDEAYFKGNKTEESLKLRFRYAADDKILLLYVGRIHPIKGIETLIRSLPLLKKEKLNAHLLVVGPDQVGYARHLKEIAELTGVLEEVTFTGFVDEGEKILLQKAADVAVLPSSFEGFGQSLIQAMAQGTPVIGTHRGAIPWVLDQGEAGLMFRYGSAAELAKCISRIMKDEELRHSIVSRGKERAYKFSYDVLVDELQEIYAEMSN